MFYGVIREEEQLFKIEDYCDFTYDGPQSINEQVFLDVLNEKLDRNEGTGAKLHPIYILLIYGDTRFDHIAEKFVKGQTYWHAALSFGPALSTCYSFSAGKGSASVNPNIKGGLAFESIDYYKKDSPKGKMKVGVVFVSNRKYKKVKEAINWFVENKEKTRYNFLNLLFSLVGKPTKNGLKLSQVCTSFVDTILKYAHINISKKQTNLTKADDMKETDEKSYFKVFEGNIVDYKERPVAKRTEELANKLGNNYFRHKKDEEAKDVTVKD